MKIQAITRNSFGQIIAEVLDCGKTVKVFANSASDLPKRISKACHFGTPEDVRTDLALNYPDYHV